MAENLMPGVYKLDTADKRHAKLISQFKRHLKVSRDAQRQKREEKWEEAENTFMAYMPEKENDALRRSARDGGIPQYTTIAIPYSYAMLLTSHTYYTSVMMARNPVFQLQGRHGESQMAEQMMESLLDYQISTGGGQPALFIWLLDVGKYGHGVLGHYWDKEMITMSQQVEVPQTFLGMPIPGKTTKQMQTTQTEGYAGNRLYNIRPQDFFPDPRVPMHRFQEGEFCLVFDKVGWNKIRQGAYAGKFYNVEKLRQEKYAQPSDRALGSPQVDLPSENFTWDSGDEKNPVFVNQHEYYLDLVPDEWGFGPSKACEKWVFTIANENLVISAQPLGLQHGKFPFDVLTNEVDGYSLFTRGMLEILEPMNQTIEWLFNSHFYNVRAALNNMFLADPSKVNIKDLEDPEPGKLIRLKPAAYGQDVRSMLAQFPVQDITRANLSDTDVVGGLAQRLVGVTDNVMGMVNQGGRKTATEVRTSTTFGLNRLKTQCEWFSMVGFSPLTQKLVQSSQQLYEKPRSFRIVGDMAQFGQRYLQVSPQDIAGFYDFVPVDGTLPVDRFAQVNLWQQLMGTMAKVPQVMQQYDLGKIFGFVAQLGGLKNINQFRIQLVPDGMVQQQAAAGNMIPMRSNPNEPGQIPGMGATG